MTTAVGPFCSLPNAGEKPGAIKSPVFLPSGVAESCLPWSTIEPKVQNPGINLPPRGLEYFERLARFLSGKTFGLVLGGGGAKGFAHIGIIRALQEANIPIDVVGGTSMGAAIASLFAMVQYIEDMIQINKKVWIEMKPLKDFTLPIMSFIRGKKFDKMGEIVYGDLQIEDLWLNYFCISSMDTVNF